MEMKEKKRTQFKKHKILSEDGIIKIYKYVYENDDIPMKDIAKKFDINISTLETIVYKKNTKVKNIFKNLEYNNIHLPEIKRKHRPRKLTDDEKVDIFLLNKMKESKEISYNDFDLSMHMEITTRTIRKIKNALDNPLSKNNTYKPKIISLYSQRIMDGTDETLLSERVQQFYEKIKKGKK